MMVAWSLWGCGPAAVDTDPGVRSFGWLDEVAFAPEQFGELTLESKEGWVQLHAGDPEAAWTAFDGVGVGATRAAIDLSTWHDDVARLTAEVHTRLWTRWAERSHQGVAAPPPAYAAWLAPLAADCAALRPGPSAPPEVLEHLAKHRAALAEGALPTMSALAAAPMAADRVSTTGEAHERQVWDPCVSASLAVGWRARAAPSGWGELRPTEAPGLAWTLMAPWSSAGELESALRAGMAPGELGPDSIAATSLAVPDAGTTADEARERVARLEAGFTAVAARILDQAPAEGAALVADLDLARRWQDGLALAFARRALRDGHPTASAVWAYSVKGPASRPSAQLLLARAELASGHPREALSALHGAGRPRSASGAESDPPAAGSGLFGVQDALSDLVVLESLGRAGDSKEDP